MASPVNPETAAELVHQLQNTEQALPLAPTAGTSGQFDAGGVRPGNPTPPVAAIDQAPRGEALSEQIILSKDLVQPSFGERLVERALGASGRYSSWPSAFAELAAPADNGTVIDTSVSSATPDPTQRAIQEMQNALQQQFQFAREMTHKINEVMMWTTEFRLVTAISTKGTQGLNTLLKNQG